MYIAVSADRSAGLAAFDSMSAATLRVAASGCTSNGRAASTRARSEPCTASAQAWRPAATTRPSLSEVNHGGPLAPARAHPWAALARSRQSALDRHGAAAPRNPAGSRRARLSSASRRREKVLPLSARNNGTAAADCRNSPKLEAAWTRTLGSGSSIFEASTPTSLGSLKLPSDRSALTLTPASTSSIALVSNPATVETARLADTAYSRLRARAAKARVPGSSARSAARRWLAAPGARRRASE
jgi:hypothetical protein